jgi:hypothetical protein
VAAGYIGAAFDPGNDGGMRAKGGLLNDLTAKAGTDYAFNGDGLIKAEFCAGIMDGQAFLIED